MKEFPPHKADSGFPQKYLTTVTGKKNGKNETHRVTVSKIPKFSHFPQLENSMQLGQQPSSSLPLSPANSSIVNK